MLYSFDDGRSLERDYIQLVLASSTSIAHGRYFREELALSMLSRSRCPGFQKLATFGFDSSLKVCSAAAVEDFVGRPELGFGSSLWECLGLAILIACNG